MIKKIWENKTFFVGFCMFSFIILIMVLGLIHLPYDYEATDSSLKLKGLSIVHLFGTDNLGRDVLSRILVGIRISVLIGFIVMIFGFVTGLILGSIAGWFGGFIDAFIMKLISVQMAFPGILLALMLAAVFEPSIKITVFALCIMSVPRFTRITRAGYIKLKNSIFVQAAIVRGAGNFRIMYIHILPNILSELLVTATFSFSMAILSESGLSYLGLGVRPPYPSFGRMLNDAQHYIFTNPLGVLIPLLFLAILVFSLNLMGDGIAEVNRN
ncbi:ABC transporter permease [Treponema pectinovorum]|uniref:ABC transporter permease n=1 Tax=Treponema pectinovorum TaxID=164 RepID=UPI003D935BDF